MSKDGDVKFLKIQTCVLKVNIHCDGCKQKVKKLLQKIDGVYTTTVDGDQGKVTVSGDVDPSALIKRLAKSGKHAVLVSPKLQLGNGGEQRSGGRNGNQKNQQVVSHMHPKMKDYSLGQMKVAPFAKEPKSAKFDFRPLDDEDSGFDDDLDDGFDDDDDDEDYDDGLDGFDDVFDENAKQIKNGKQVGSCDKKGGGGGNGGVNGKKGGGSGGGGGAYGNMQNKLGLGGKDGNKYGSITNGGKDCKYGSIPNGKKGGGGGQENGKRVVQSVSNDYNNNSQGSKKGGNNPYMNQGMANGSGLYPTGAVNNIAMHPMTHTGNGSAGVQAIGGPSPVYYHGGPSPELTAPSTNPYLSAMMQQQKSMMMMNNGPSDRMFQPVAYSRQPFPVNYIPPPPSEYTHFFSDENTGNCSIM